MLESGRFETSKFRIEAIMAKKTEASSASKGSAEITPMVAATLAGVIYQARLLNRQAKLNIPADEVISDVIQLCLSVHGELAQV